MSMRGALILSLVLTSLTMASSHAASFPDWHQMDKATLDASYNNSAAVPESKVLFGEWIKASQAFREAHADHLNIPYGPSPREKLDLFLVGPNAPTLVFIHGGFWQMRSKDDFAFLAAPYVKAGVNVVMVGYPLAPDAHMTEIVAASKRAIAYVHSHVKDWQGDPTRVVVTGWSSGGHLTAEVMDDPIVKAAVPLSGIFDLEPLVGSYVNEKLKLSPEEVQSFSPQRRSPPTGRPIYLFVGGAELSEMRRQTHDYAAKLQAMHQVGEFKELPGKNHYTILADMADPNGEIYQTLMRLLEVSKQ